MEKRHFLTLDWLRGVAALLVVLFHMAHWRGGLFYPRGGYLAVDFFFMLSGFVIDYAYAERLKTSMRFSQFVRIRVIRLYPLIIVGATLGLLAVLVGKPFSQAGQLTIASAFPFAALALPNPSFIHLNHFVLNAPAWSIFFELVANLVFAIFLFRLSLNQLVGLTAIFAVGLALTAFHFGTVGFGDDRFWYWRGFMRVAFPFSMGMLLNRIASRTKIISLPFLPASGILLATFFVVPFGDRPWPAELACVFIVYPLLILGAQASNFPTSGSAIAKLSGFISYPLYILHWPVLDLIAIGFAAAAQGWSSPKAVLVLIPIACGAGIVDSWVRRRVSEASSSAFATHDGIGIPSKSAAAKASRQG